MYIELPAIIKDKNAEIHKLHATVIDLQQALKRMEADKQMWMKFMPIAKGYGRRALKQLVKDGVYDEGFNL